MWHSSKEHFFEDKFEKRLNFGHFCSYVLNSAKKSHMIWNFQRRYFLMGILCKLTPWRWHHSKYPMPKLALEFSFKFQKSNLFYYSTLTKCSNQHSISRILKPRFFKQKRLVWKHCFHGSNIWSWKLKNNTLPQTVCLPIYDLFEFDHSLGRSIVRIKKFQVKMSIVAYFGSYLATQKKTLGKTRSKILKP